MTFRRRQGRACLVLSISLVSAAAARAEQAPPDGGLEVSAPRRAAAAGVALVPGIVVPGLGHFVAGEARTGRRLLLIGGIGLGTSAAGVVGLALTGASPRTVAPLALMTTLGVGTLLCAAFADLYGVLVPPGRAGLAPGALPDLQADLGLRYVHDPTFSYGAFAAAGADVRFGRLRLSPSVWAALDDDNLRAVLAAGWRLAGGDRHDGSQLELVTALTHHRYGDEAFSTTTGELALAGRLDLARLAPSLAGAFGELGAGFALGAVRYHDLTTEPTDLLLASMAFGVYLGRGRGEVALTYDHRHDGYAAGLKLTGLGSGPAGHFGLRAKVWVAGAWGVLLDAQVGSATVAGLSLLYRRGAR